MRSKRIALTHSSVHTFQQFAHRAYLVQLVEPKLHRAAGATARLLRLQFQDAARLLPDERCVVGTVVGTVVQAVVRTVVGTVVRTMGGALR